MSALPALSRGFATMMSRPPPAEQPGAGGGGAKAFFDTASMSRALSGKYKWLAGAGAALAIGIGLSVLREPTPTDHVWMDIAVDGEAPGLAPTKCRVCMELYGHALPKTVENFKGLATNAAGYGYKGTRMFRLQRSFTVWGGDVVAGDGSSMGASVYGPAFSVEGMPVRHVRGAVSMVQDDDGALRSQFFFTLMAAPALDRKAVAFGRVVEGLDCLDRISRLPVNDKGAPLRAVRITDCGVLQQTQPAAAAPAAAPEPQAAKS